jgi:hypothetical protein
LGIGAFVEKTLVHSGQCTKVNPAIAPKIAGRLRRRRQCRHRRGRASGCDHDHRNRR